MEAIAFYLFPTALVKLLKSYSYTHCSLWVSNNWKTRHFVSKYPLRQQQTEASLPHATGLLHCR
jgi:hypothetical protein